MSKDIATIIALDQYPILDLSSEPACKLISHCKQQLADNGLCLLKNFIQQSALKEIQQCAQALLPDAHYTEHWRATPNGDSSSSVSVLAETTRASMSSIGYDRLDNDAPLRLLYSSEHFTAFVNTLFEGPELYITADPLIGCMLTSMSDGDELGWHYDPNDIVVSLSIQDPEAGGEFEFAPRIRLPQTHAAKHEKAVLAGTYDAVVQKSLQPGTLSLFNGHSSLHRVAPVVGQKKRIVALFNYSEVPYYGFDEKIQRRFFGRVAKSNLT